MKIFFKLVHFASIDLLFRLTPKPPQNFAVKSAHFREVFVLKLCVVSCHPYFLNFTPLDISAATTSQSFIRRCTMYSRSEYTSLLLYTEVGSGRNNLVDGLFVLQKKLLRFFQTKDYTIQKILEDINFILHPPFLFVKYFGSNK